MDVSKNGGTQQPWFFPTENDHFGVFWAYFWKHPYIGVRISHLLVIYYISGTSHYKSRGLPEFLPEISTISSPNYPWTCSLKISSVKRDTSEAANELL